jgi:hypothetical protein
MTRLQRLPFRKTTCFVIFHAPNALSTSDLRQLRGEERGFWHVECYILQQDGCRFTEKTANFEERHISVRHANFPGRRGEQTVATPLFWGIDDFGNS